MVLSSPSVNGDTPDDREGHTASVIGTHIVIFGGTWTDEEDNTLYMNDLHAFDTTSKCWHRPLVNGIPPIEREGHTAASVESTIYILGGTWVDDEDNSTYLNDLFAYDMEGARWTQPTTTGDPPIQREGHTASVIDRQMVVFGGAGLDAEERSVRA